MPDPTFAIRILRAMRSVAQDAGHPSAYPHTRAGVLATLRLQLRAMKEDAW